LRCRTFFASGAPSDHRPGDADPALKQIYLRVTQPTANSEEAKKKIVAGLLLATAMIFLALVIGGVFR
jgi:hypothetical protein